MSQTSAETPESAARMAMAPPAREPFEIRITFALGLCLCALRRVHGGFRWRRRRRERLAARGPPASREPHPPAPGETFLRQCTPPHRLRCFGTRASRAGNASLTSVLRRSPAGPWFRPISFLRSGLPPPALRRGSPRDVVEAGSVEFESLTDRIARNFAEALRAYEQVLRGGAGLFRGPERRSRAVARLHRLARPGKDFPAFKASASRRCYAARTSPRMRRRNVRRA